MIKKLFKYVFKIPSFYYYEYTEETFLSESADHYDLDYRIKYLDDVKHNT